MRKEGGNMTIKEALEKGTIMLKGEDLDSPKLKARLLLQDVLNKPRQYLLVHDTEEINNIHFLGSKDYKILNIIK